MSNFLYKYIQAVAAKMNFWQNFIGKIRFQNSRLEIWVIPKNIFRLCRDFKKKPTEIGSGAINIPRLFVSANKSPARSFDFAFERSGRI